MKIEESLVASIRFVFSPITSVLGLVVIWGINASKQNNKIITMIARKRNYFREKLAHCRLKFLNKRPCSCWFKKGRTDLWWEDMWNGIAPEEQWRKNFRMSRESFRDLLAELNPYISPNDSSPNYRTLSAEKKLALTLYFLKDTGSLE